MINYCHTLLTASRWRWWFIEDWMTVYNISILEFKELIPLVFQVIMYIFYIKKKNITQERDRKSVV